MEQEQQTQPQAPQKKKIGAKEIVSLILVATVAVLAKTAIRALFSDSSSSSDYQVEVDLDLPDPEPIDFSSLVDDAFEEAAQKNAEENPE